MDAKKGPPSDTDHLPAQVGPYVVLRALGEGGMGSVYLANDPSLPRHVAVKVVRLGMGSRDLLARFEQERAVLARMDHRSIARVLDAGTTEQGQPYFVMEYVPGRPLVDYCDERRLGIRERLVLFRKVCEAVQHAHQKGVMHRDLKPGNILVKEEEDDLPVPKIIDFGLARALYPGGQGLSVVTEQGRVLGTPEYMSPEQAGGAPQDLDTRTDVYSLGVILYELLVGELPFSREMLSQAGVLEMHRIIREVDPPTPSSRIRHGVASDTKAEARGTTADRLFRVIAHDLDWITRKAMEKVRHRRYASAHALAEDIERFLNDEPVLAGPPGNAYRLRKWLRRHRVALTTGTSLVFGLSGVGLFLASVRDAQAAERARQLDQDPALLATLVQEHETGPWRAATLHEGFLGSWMERAHGLLDRLPAHRARLQRWRTQDQPPIGLSWDYWDGFLEDAAKLREPDAPMAHFQSLADLPGQLADPTGEVAASWDRALAAIAASPRYAGLRLLRLPQLAPLGENAQGLWEFYVPGTGVRPHTDDGGGVAVADDQAIVLVLLPGGEFDLGAEVDAGGDVPRVLRAVAEEGPPLRVKLRPFLIGKYEVTQRQWQRLAGFNDSNGRERPEWAVLPVERVTWLESRTVPLHWGLCLPTEAQWQYACLAGGRGPWCVADWRQLDDVANLADAAAERAGAGPAWAELMPELDDSFALTAPVGSLRANAFGLHDMHGNVYELCLEPYTSLENGALDDGKGTLAGDGSGDAGYGVTRGGSFRSGPWRLRASHRQSVSAHERSVVTGLRVACWPW